MHPRTHVEVKGQFASWFSSSTVWGLENWIHVTSLSTKCLNSLSIPRFSPSSKKHQSFSWGCTLTAPWCYHCLKVLAADTLIWSSDHFLHRSQWVSEEKTHTRHHSPGLRGNSTVPCGFPNSAPILSQRDSRAISVAWDSHWFPNHLLKMRINPTATSHQNEKRARRHLSP